MKEEGLLGSGPHSPQVQEGSGSKSHPNEDKERAGKQEGRDRPSRQLVSSSGQAILGAECCPDYPGERGYLRCLELLGVRASPQRGSEQPNTGSSREIQPDNGIPWVRALRKSY